MYLNNTIGYGMLSVMNFYENCARLRGELVASTAEYLVEANDEWVFDQRLFPHDNSVEGHTFKRILGEGISLQSVIDDRRRVGKPTNVLELFGSAAFLHFPDSADSLTGVRLKDTSYAGRSRHRGVNHQVVLGDVYDLSTLEGVTDNLRSRNIPSIDVAVIGPYGGWGKWSLDYEPNVLLDTFYPILDWTYQRLNPDEGRILAESPPLPIDMPVYEFWGRQMERSGIHTTITEGIRYPVMNITRLPQSPARIVPLVGRYAPPK